MARKQSDYLAALLADDESVPEVSTEEVPTQSAPSPAPDLRTQRARGTTLLGRESALARVASGEVRQVTQLLLDPAKVRVWSGNARSYEHLTEASCQELLDSIVAEGGQKVPAVVRRIEGDPNYDYEVIAGTRRHWSISWLRAHSYPEMMFVAQVAQLDDEAAFRLADLENRARKDVSDLERARNYAAALKSHYGNHQSRMAERLKLSKGWLSKMLKVASLPDAVVAAFSSPAEVQLKPAYPLAQAMDDRLAAASILKAAKGLASEQATRVRTGAPALPAAEVLTRLLAAPHAETPPAGPIYNWLSPHGRSGLSVISTNRQGATVRVHAGSGAHIDELVEAFRQALISLEEQGKGVRP
jgi:ParB family chromosome partitioning protein